MRRAVFHRGDPTNDGKLDITEAVSLFRFLFLGGSIPPCRESADVENNGRIDLSDGIAILRYLFLRAGPPAEPGPPGTSCGLDPDPIGSRSDLGCELYNACEVRVK